MPSQLNSGAPGRGPKDPTLGSQSASIDRCRPPIATFRNRMTRARLDRLRENQERKGIQVTKKHLKKGARGKAPKLNVKLDLIKERVHITWIHFG